VFDWKNFVSKGAVPVSKHW